MSKVMLVDLVLQLEQARADKAEAMKEHNEKIKNLAGSIFRLAKDIETGQKDLFTKDDIEEIQGEAKTKKGKNNGKAKTPEPAKPIEPENEPQDKIPLPTKKERAKKQKEALGGKEIIR